MISREQIAALRADVLAGRATHDCGEWWSPAACQLCDRARFRVGERVFVTFDGTTVRADVFLASTNGYSLAVIGEWILGGYVGIMPVRFVPERERFEDLIRGLEVVLSREEDHCP